MKAPATPETRSEIKAKGLGIKPSGEPEPRRRRDSEINAKRQQTLEEVWMPLLRSSSEHTNEQAESLLSVEAVARALSLSKSTVYTLCWEGQLPSMKLGRRRMIRRSDLIAYIESLENSGA